MLSDQEQSWGSVLEGIVSRMSHDGGSLERHIRYTRVPESSLFDPRAHRNMVQQYLIQAQAAIETVSQLSRKIKDIEGELHRHCAKLSTSLQPIATPPTEVLQYIFVLSNNQSHSDTLRTPQPIVLSQVCSTWRHAVHSCSELWTTVNINLDTIKSLGSYEKYSNGKPLHAYSTYLRRDPNKMIVLARQPDIQRRIVSLHLHNKAEFFDFNKWANEMIRGCVTLQTLELCSSPYRLHFDLRCIQDLRSFQSLSPCGFPPNRVTPYTIKLTTLNLAHLCLTWKELSSLMSAELEVLTFSD